MKREQTEADWSSLNSRRFAFPGHSSSLRHSCCTKRFNVGSPSMMCTNATLIFETLFQRVFVWKFVADDYWCCCTSRRWVGLQVAAAPRSCYTGREGLLVCWADSNAVCCTATVWAALINFSFSLCLCTLRFYRKGEYWHWHHVHVHTCAGKCRHATFPIISNVDSQNFILFQSHLSNYLCIPKHGACWLTYSN